MKERESNEIEQYAFIRAASTSPAGESKKGSNMFCSGRLILLSRGVFRKARESRKRWIQILIHMHASIHPINLMLKKQRLENGFSSHRRIVLSFNVINRRFHHSIHRPSTYS